MCMLFPMLCLLAVFSAVESGTQTVGITEDCVCNVKTSCLECLRLDQCSWCVVESKCFSTKLPTFEGFCQNNTILAKDYGLSIEENAECSCANGDLEQNCHPPGIIDGPVCSGRGSCECGRCVCDPSPDPDHPTKVVIGEYCEYDNFSCDAPDCDEGPYPLSPPDHEDEQPKIEITLAE